MISSKFTFQHQLKVINFNYARASEASERLRINSYFFAFHVPKLLFLSMILLALQILYLYKMCRFKFVTPVYSIKFPLYY